MCRIFLAVFTASIFFNSFSASAQMAQYELGINAGTYVYQGDLAPGLEGSFKTIKPGVGISVLKPVMPFLGISANFTYARMAGDDKLYADVQDYREHRAFAFAGKVRELSVMANYFPLGLDNRRKLEPYIAAGAGINLKKVERDYSRFVPEMFNPVENLEERLKEDLAVNPSKPHIIFPVAVGVRYHLSPKLAIGAGVNYRFSTTDYIDGYSISGNPGLKDHYYGGTVGVIFRKGDFVSKKGCPVNVL